MTLSVCLSYLVSHPGALSFAKAESNGLKKQSDGKSIRIYLGLVWFTNIVLWVHFRLELCWNQYFILFSGEKFYSVVVTVISHFVKLLVSNNYHLTRLLGAKIIWIAIWIHCSMQQSASHYCSVIVTLQST